MKNHLLPKITLETNYVFSLVMLPTEADKVGDVPH